MKLEVKRIDQLGIIAGTIREIGLVEIVNEKIGMNDQEEITAGQTLAGMILNGLGFVSRPLMLTPQFFENKALELLIGKGVKPEHFNRHKIGRVLDKVSEFGCEKLFSIIAMKACLQQSVDMSIGHGDTTSYSLTGDYDSDSDTERINVTHGHSKAKRPDLKQLVQELVTTQDGGIPFVTKVWSGNTSDTVILRERAKTLIDEFKKSTKRFFVADSKMYTEETAKTLDQINFITRVPSSIKLEKTVIDQAYQKLDSWLLIEKGYKLQEFPIDNYQIKDQRWIVVYSEEARKRSEKTIEKDIKKEAASVKKELFHLQAERFSCENDAQKKLIKLAKKWKYHQPADVRVTSINCSTKRGRPTKESLELEWQITAAPTFNKDAFDKALNQRSCFVLATNVSPQDLPMEQVLSSYKGQDKTEKGFAFLKSPDVFVSSLFLKKPSRLDALLMVMVLSLLVYSIAQRSLRNRLALLKSTLPNQINKETQNPTMRWIFQLFEGVNYVTVFVNETATVVIEGITPIRARILGFLSPAIQAIYQNKSAWG